MESSKVWSREFTGMAVINFLFAIQFFLFMVTMAPYTTETYSESISVGGFVASVFVIGSLVGRLLAGKLMTSYGASKLLKISLIAFLVISLGYFVSYSIEVLVIIRVLHGIVSGMIMTASGTICVQVTPPTRQGEGIAYYSITAVLGAAIGPFVGIYFLEMENGFQWIFLLNTLLGICSLIILKMTKLHLSTKEFNNISSKQPLTIGMFVERKAVPISILALIFGFCFSGLTSYLVIYCEEIGAIEAASYYFLVHTVFIICSRLFTGKLIDSRGASIVLYPCFILFGFGLFVYSQASEVWMVLCAAAFISTGFGNFNSSAQTVAVKSADNNRMGVAIATFGIFMDLGTGVGPYILGFIIEHFGFRQMYMGMSVIAFMCIPLYYYFYNRKEKCTLQQQVN